MKKLVFILAALVLVGCSEPLTAEQIEAQIELEKVRYQNQQLEDAARHAREMERMDKQAEIDAQKPASVRVSEEAADSVDNAVNAAVGVGIGAGALWLFGKMIDGM
jgi:type II secretory pathway component PulM